MLRHALRERIYNCGAAALQRPCRGERSHPVGPLRAARERPASGGHADGDAEGQSRRVDLGIGKSVIVDLPRDAKEVFVANPKVANAIVRSTRKIFVIGQADGQTNVVVHGRRWTPDRQSRHQYRARPERAAPDPQGRDARPAWSTWCRCGDTIVLTGMVAIRRRRTPGDGHRQGLRRHQHRRRDWR